MKFEHKRDQAKDTGLALTLVLLLVAHFGRNDGLIMPAIAVLVLTMTWPAIFGPFSRIWFGFSHWLGNSVSRILLFVVFLLIVTPVGLFRKILGADPMRMKEWKRGRDSVFQKRDHQYTAKDLERPY